MKFGSLLKERLSDLPECASLLEFYKQLKFTLLKPVGNKVDRETEEEVHSSLVDIDAVDCEFLSVLRQNLEEFNLSYLEAEEVLVIQMRELADKFTYQDDVECLNDIYKSSIDLHGEMLLLMNWSMLAYTSVVKILKKHEKCTGRKLHAPEMEDLLAEPFCATETTRSLVGKCAKQVEAIANRIAQLRGSLDALAQPSSSLGSVPKARDLKRIRSPSPYGEDLVESRMCKRAQARNFPCISLIYFNPEI